MSDWIIWFRDLGMDDVPTVGGKNASLGEMIANLTNVGIKVPDGFATTAEAYRAFIRHQSLDQKINHILDNLDVDDVDKLRQAGSTIRNMVIDQTHCLYKRIRRGRTNEFPAQFFQIL